LFVILEQKHVPISCLSGITTRKIETENANKRKGKHCHTSIYIYKTISKLNVRLKIFHMDP